ncbi:hypothetical protein J2X31_003096 [Flavobacterium arsenatis]|uniref:Uncharacterized protein n=1 Tax=Flavobacterium arsenatis TaxID=1484332 RepID=A0ABU1TT84_9FLAO|nr:hypothetical protein [Flavobacterium arsenatis]
MFYIADNYIYILSNCVEKKKKLIATISFNAKAQKFKLSFWAFYKYVIILSNSNSSPEYLHQ